MNAALTRADHNDSTEDISDRTKIIKRQVHGRAELPFSATTPLCDDFTLCHHRNCGRAIDRTSPDDRTHEFLINRISEVLAAVARRENSLRATVEITHFTAQCS